MKRRNKHGEELQSSLCRILRIPDGTVTDFSPSSYTLLGTISGRKVIGFWRQHGEIETWTWLWKDWN